MPYKCCVPGCSTGYASQQQESDVSLHKFPGDEALCEEWLRKIPRKDFVPTKNSRVCAVHFSANDFITERMDSKTKRNISRGERIRRTLRENSVPSIFPNLPIFRPQRLRPEPQLRLLRSAGRKNYNGMKVR